MRMMSARRWDTPPPERQDSSRYRASRAPDGDDRRRGNHLRGGPGRDEARTLGDNHAHAGNAEGLSAALVRRPDHERGVSGNLVAAEGSRQREDHERSGKPRMEGRQNQRCAGQYGQRAHPAGPAARARELSPYGLRALSRRHADQPFTLHLAGARYAVDYEPITGLFGGNSNWRGRIWFPVSYLVIEALHTYARFFGDDILIEHPAGYGRRVTLTVLADDLARRLVSIVLDEENGRRPVFGDARPLPDPPGLAQPAALPRVLPR